MEELMNEWKRVCQEYVAAQAIFDRSDDMYSIDSAIFDLKKLEAKMSQIRKKMREVQKL